MELRTALEVGRADGRLGGHFVTGHIDGLGRITRWERSGADHVLDIAAPPEVMRALAFLLVARLLSRKAPAAQERIYRAYAFSPNVLRASELARRQRGRKVISSAQGKVYEETGYGLTGINGESRSGDANGQYIRVAAGGGTNTLYPGHGFTVVSQPQSASVPFVAVMASCP